MDTAAILEPFKAFVTRILFFHASQSLGPCAFESLYLLNCRIKSECGSIPRQSFEEFFVK